jgi:hypothetical protein
VLGDGCHTAQDGAGSGGARERAHRTRVPGGQPGLAAGRRGQRGRLRLFRPARRHQRAQFRRPQLRAGGHRRGGELRSRPGREGAAGDQYLPSIQRRGALAAGGGRGRLVEGGRRHTRRPRPDAVRRARASRPAPAPVGSKLGDRLRGDQLLSPALRDQARGAAAGAVSRAGGARDPAHPRADRGVRLRR